MRGSSRRALAVELLRSGLFGPRSLASLAAAAARSGTSLVALVRFGAARGRAGAVVADEHERVALLELAEEADRLASLLAREHAVGPGRAVAILGANGVGFVRALLALSRLGARAVLLNPHLPVGQIVALLDRHHVALVLSPDGALDPAIGRSRHVCKPEALREAGGAAARLPRIVRGEIVVLTGGTTGLPKPARRATAPGGVLRLFLHLVAALQLDRRRAVHIAVPLFHGFGLAALIVALALGRSVHLRRRFDGGEASALILREEVDMLVATPTVLQRLLRADDARPPLACIVSGGASLPPAVLADARARCGDILFNLYGTSEAGLSALATPADLAAAPGTVGRPVWGARIRLRDPHGAPVAQGATGALFVRNRASIAPREWIATGDLGHRDRQGRLFLHGRADDMIVSGGENVHPGELETVLLAHPAVEEAIAVGVADIEFGQRLAAFVVLRRGCEVDASALSAWLRGRAARHLTPRTIDVRGALPLTGMGKVDRRALSRPPAG